jgi:hypothetical protein
MRMSQFMNREETLPGEIRNRVEDCDHPAPARTTANTRLRIALEARLHGVCASAKVEQTGPHCFRVTAPPECIVALVKAKDRAPALACTVQFFERWPQPSA